MIAEDSYTVESKLFQGIAAKCAVILKMYRACCPEGAAAGKRNGEKMGKKYSVVALGSGGMRRVVAYYDTFAEAFAHMDKMSGQGASVGFHIRYDILYDGCSFFWTLADAADPEKVCELLDAWDMFDDVSQPEKLESTKAAMDAGVIFANGEVVAILPQE